MRLTLFYNINNDELSIKLLDFDVYKIDKTTRAGSPMYPYLKIVFN